jgi:NADPH-dependent curcumin reductase
VLGGFGWQRFSVVGPERLFKVPEADPPISSSLGVLGMPGLTAWTGLADIGQPKAGETVVISAASGAVGQVAGQIAKIRGCKVVGIAGGAKKCDFVVKELGFDACLDHRGDLNAQLDATVPEGIDVYWENVGGAVQAAVFPRFKDFGRMVMCGMVAQYNEAPGADAAGAPPGPNLGPIVRKRLRIQGFIVSDTGWPRYPQFRAEMLGWMKRRQAALARRCGAGPGQCAQGFHRPAEGREFRQAGGEGRLKAWRRRRERFRAKWKHLATLTCPPEMFPNFGRVCFSRGRTNEAQQVQR